MRKIAVILLSLLLGSICGTEAFAGSLSEEAACPVQVGFDSPVREELRCEKEYNSDLGVPRPAAEVEPVRTLSVRTLSCPERQGVKCGVSCGREGYTVNCLPEFTINLLLAGDDSVDYYVYRLRRLLI